MSTKTKNMNEKIVKLIKKYPNDSDLGKTIRNIYYTESELDQEEKSDSQITNDLYLRTYADFENYKKRAQKEKEEIKNSTKVSLLSSILDLDNDLSIAFSKEKNEGILLIMSKVDKFLKSHGVETIPTDSYNPDVHEVVSLLDSGNNIVDVVSKGYKLDDKVIRYPKVILG